MGKIGVFLYDGFQEMEFWYPVLRLREVGADVVVIGVAGAEAASSVLGYPVVPNVAMNATSPGDYAALVIPGGNVARLADDGAFRAFVRDAAQKRVRIAAASQAASLAPDSLVARTTDDVPQWTRNLITELSR
ncbi:MAG TPA: DJ-1/PfpI family protein [Casimicrobiaceae bacterium]|jgi:protease I|nr:DJ-1/PfpI family protein [Casimicrobiaceae bacterium]